MTSTSVGHRDLLAESLAGISGRPGRSALTTAGITLGVATFVVTIGLTSTVSAQITSRFDELKSTEVTAVDSTPRKGKPFQPEELKRRLGMLNGVVTGGEWWSLDESYSVSALESEEAAESLPLVAVGPGALEAMRPTLANGEPFQAWHYDKGAPVVLLGAAAARSLNVGDLTIPRAVWVEGRPLTVIGTISDVRRHPEVLLGLVIPASTAEQNWEQNWSEEKTKRQILIETDPGAAQLVGRQLAVALQPHDPHRFWVIVPPDPDGLRNAVSGDLTNLLLLMAGVSMLIGAFGIANTTLVSVIERSNEIGLRRAMGARRRDIRFQFLGESGLLGAGGGVVGTIGAVWTIALIAVVQGWTVVMSPIVVLVAPALGALTGLLAGVYPAARAARTEPLDALR